MKHEEETTVNMTAMLDAVKSSDETDTTKTGSTPPSSADTTASSSSTLNDEQEPLQYDDVILAHLARQLEYYFSKANLEKDTYVQTLRELNDGCVPVSILQRFSKVQYLAPIETMDAIIKATSEQSSLLEIVAIDAKTGKRVVEEETAPPAAGSNTIWAVGSRSGEPLDNSILQGVVPTTPSTPGAPVQNTIIIREVDSRVTEAEVRALFDDEHCPPIQSLYLDVYNCWFVTLDTTSRDDMLYAMMQLRCQYLGDEPVKARLKSIARQVDPASAPPLPALTPVCSYTHLSNLVPPHLQESSSAGGGASSNKGSSSKRKQKKRPSKNPNNRGNSNNGGQGGKKNATSPNQHNNSNSNREEGSHKKPDGQKQQPKPDLSDAAFPALTASDDSNYNRKVEVVVDGMDAEPKATGSDSASTTTTMSSSSSSETKGKQLLGGYAAALRKAKPADGSLKSGYRTQAHNIPEQGQCISKAAGDSEDKVTVSPHNQEVATEKANLASNAAIKSAPVVVKPPAWGSGRTFADVLAM